MTIAEAIAHVDRLKPNQYSKTTKINWLSKLDGQIFTEIIKTHENSPVETFTGYDEEMQDQNINLLVPYPYDEDIYNYYLQAQIDKENGEIAKYNQSKIMYSNALKAFQNWYNQTNMPKAAGKRFLF